MPVPPPPLFQDQCIGAANAGNVILAPAAEEQLFEIMSGRRMDPPGRRCRVSIQPGWVSPAVTRITVGL